jgi:hypothetical protein
MPIPLFNPPNSFYASKGAEQQLHNGLDTQFWGRYCGIDSQIYAEAYELVEAGRVIGNSPGSYWPVGTELKGNDCYRDALAVDYMSKGCFERVKNAKKLVSECASNGWTGGICVTYPPGGGWITHFDMDGVREFAENGQAECEAEKKRLEEEVWGQTCEQTTMDFTVPEERYISNYNKNGDFTGYDVQIVNVHPCASVGDMNSAYNYQFPEKSSAVAVREMNPKLDEAKVKFLAPLISTIRSAYFLAGGIIGGWLVYLNAKSENLSFGENFLAKYPASIPTIPSYSGGIGGSPS